MRATELPAPVDATVQRLLGEGAVLCIRFTAGERVVEACRAAARGGLRVLEITLTTPGALEAIHELSGDEELLVGAGTVLEAKQVRAVAEAGGRFALSPVFGAEVLAEAAQHGLLYIPGAATPTEILAAYSGGASLVKVFPAAALGGPSFLRAVRGPLPHVPLIPTSGPTADSLGDYFEAGAVAVGIGAEVFPPDFTLDQVEAAARCVRESIDRARQSDGTA